MIRVAIVDDHHAVRLGLNAALQSEPGLVPVGAAGILNNGLPSRDLFEAVRDVNCGGSALPAISDEHLQVVAAALDEQDLPILAC